MTLPRPTPVRLDVIAAIATAAFALCGANPVAADPARFWFSLSDTDPYRNSLYEAPGSQPGAPVIDLVPGATQTIYLWARPQTDSQGDFDRLLNVSLNLDVPTSSPNICFDSVEIYRNETSGAPFDQVIDSDDPLSVNTSIFPDNPIFVDYPIFSSAGVTRFAGFNLLNTGSPYGLGIDADPHQDAWLFGEVEVRALNSIGTSQANLQVGSLSISHGETPISTEVTFGDELSVVYNADSHREVTLGNSPEITVNVVDHWPGDLVDVAPPVVGRDGVVNALDYTFWREGGANPTVYGQWTGDYGRTTPANPTNDCHVGGGSIPEPSGLLLCSAAIVLASSRRRGATACLAFALCLGGLLPQQHATAQVTAIWDADPQTGSWGTPTNWDIGFVPDNGVEGNDYSVLISMPGMPGGNPYTVTLNTGVTVDSVTLDSSDATLDVSGATLGIVNFLQILDGDLTLTGGTITGGTILGNPGAFPVVPFTSNNGVLDGVSLVGDLGPGGIAASASLTLRNGASIDGNYVVDGFEPTLIFDQDNTLTSQMLSVTGFSSGVSWAGRTFSIDSTSTVLLTDPEATIGSIVAGTTLSNSGTIRGDASIGGVPQVRVESFTSTGLVEVLAEELVLESTGVFNNTGVFDVRSGATLSLEPPSQPSGYQHTGGAEVRGAGTLRVDSNGDSFFNASDEFVNDAIVRPGNPIGALTITGDYTQAAGGVLEIEANGTVAGSTHDQLVVTDEAKLGGRLDLQLGYTPAIDDRIQILSAGSVTPGFEFESYSVSGNPLPEGVAQQISYGPAYVRVEFVPAFNTALEDPGGLPVSWSAPATWSDGLPDSTANVAIDFDGSPGTVEVTDVATINAANSLIVGGEPVDLTLSIDAAALSVTSTTVIEDKGTIDLTGADAQLSSRTVEVLSGGALSGAGTLLTEQLSVGVSGAGTAEFDPEGTFAVEGDYTQGAQGRLSISIGGGTQDLVTVSGAASLDGDLVIDASGLTPAEIAPGTVYEILSSVDSLSGVFDDVQVIGNSNVKFAVTYETGLGGGSGIDSSALATQFCAGDATGDCKVTSDDAIHFARTLVDNRYVYVCGGDDGCSQNVGRMMKQVFNINEDGSVDFADVPGFTALLMAGSDSLTLPEAQSIIQTAFVQALSEPVIPEPCSGSLLLIVLILSTQRRDSQ